MSLDLLSSKVRRQHYFYKYLIALLWLLVRYYINLTCNIKAISHLACICRDMNIIARFHKELVWWHHSTIDSYSVGKRYVVGWCTGLWTGHLTSPSPHQHKLEHLQVPLLCISTKKNENRQTNHFKSWIIYELPYYVGGLYLGHPSLVKTGLAWIWWTCVIRVSLKFISPAALWIIIVW